VLLIRKGYDELKNHDFNEQTIFTALNLLARFIEKSVKNSDDLNYIYASAYIAAHYPNYVNNTLDMSSFCSRFNLNKDTIEGIIQDFIDELDLIFFPDNNGDTFFIDKEGVLYSIIFSVAKQKFNNAVLSKVLDLSEFDLDELTDELTDYLINTIRILPDNFSKSCNTLIKNILKQFL